MIDISIKENIDLIEKNLNGRAQLICVTKFRSKEEVDTLHKLGIKDIAENKVQNLIEKKEDYGRDFNYHMIVIINNNKLKQCAGWFYFIHFLYIKSILYQL
ncbi:MAG: hypothetical protein Q4E50_04405 [Tissierellia bacterium]|nr:hypothetical protein [Tissierellia bacterium]